MGRDEESGLLRPVLGRRATVLGENGVYKSAGAAFAFGARDVNDVEAVEICRLSEGISRQIINLLPLAREK